MHPHGAAAPSNNLCTAITRHYSIIRHQLRGAIIMDMAIDIFWNSGIAFCNDRGLGFDGRKPLNGAQQIRSTSAAIGPKGLGGIFKAIDHVYHGRCSQTHHCPPGSVKTHRAAP